LLSPLGHFVVPGGLARTFSTTGPKKSFCWRFGWSVPPPPEGPRLMNGIFPLSPAFSRKPFSAGGSRLSPSTSPPRFSLDSRPWPLCSGAGGFWACAPSRASDFLSPRFWGKPVFAAKLHSIALRPNSSKIAQGNCVPIRVSPLKDNFHSRGTWIFFAFSSRSSALEAVPCSWNVIFSHWVLRRGRHPSPEEALSPELFPARCRHNLDASSRLVPSPPDFFSRPIGVLCTSRIFA